MTKSKMNIKQKTRKRERNKKNVTVEETGFKRPLITSLVVVGFIAVIYLGALGLEKLGVFEAGYTKPDTSASIGYDNILLGETFNRPETEYLVLFDTFGDKTNDTYIEYLADQYGTHVYHVDMCTKENESYKSDTANLDASSSSELKINDITLITISNGAISRYLTGADAIAEALK